MLPLLSRNTTSYSASGIRVPWVTSSNVPDIVSCVTVVTMGVNVAVGEMNEQIHC